MAALPEVETRGLALKPELRSEGEKRTIVGYAATFGAAADIGGMFREVIAPGAFAASLASEDVRALYDHDPGRVLGRMSAGTLRLREDERGLAVEIDLPDTSDGRDVETLLARGDLDGMSFGFVAERQTWDETTTPPTRTLEQVRLYEVSAVAWPAYGGTSLALRSMQSALGDRQAAEAAELRRRAEGRRRELELFQPR